MVVVQNIKSLNRFVTQLTDLNNNNNKEEEEEEKPNILRLNGKNTNTKKQFKKHPRQTVHGKVK